MTDPDAPRDETTDDSGSAAGPTDTGSTDTGSTDTGSTGATARKPASAAAAAASRARRIGGRTAAARPADPAAGGQEADPSAAPTIKLDKTPSAATDSATEPASGAKADTKADTKAEKKAAAKAEKAVGASTGPSRLLLWTPAAVLTVAAIVFAVLVAVSTHGEQWGRPSAGGQRDRVLAAAKSCVVTTNSYTYTAIPAFEKKALTCASGNFAKQLTKTVQDVILKDAPTTKQVQKLQINSGGVIDVTKDNQWDILIYGQLSVTNTTNTTPRLDPFASVVRMTKISGTWKITSLCTAQFAGPINACYS